MRLLSSDNVVGKVPFFANADDVQKHQLGFRVQYTSSDYSTTANVPNAGGGELMYVKAGGTFAVGRVVHWDKDFGILDMPNTAGTGRPVGICVSAFTATNAFGWIMLAGVAPVSFSVAATTGLVYFGAAGQASPTQSAGKQILGASTLIAAAGTFTRAVRTQNLSTRVSLNATDVTGIYPGMAISGTGIPGGATVSSIDLDGRTVVISAAATASASVTATFTHTGFGIVQLNHPHVQGQIL